MQKKPASVKKSIIAWCLFDAGNSAFATVIITFIFSVYFARSVVGDETLGSSYWSYAMAASGLAVALSGPVLGAVADHFGARKPWLLCFSLICILATALLFFVTPDPAIGNIALALSLLVIANIGFEIALVFANAMLPHIAPPEMIGRISGWAWGTGYIGGLLCLVLALVGLVGIGDMAPLLPLPEEKAVNIRATAPLAALWFTVFTLPLLLWTQDSKRTSLPLGRAVKEGLTQLAGTIRTVRSHKNLLLFLIASALYRDGLATLFAVGGLYAAGIHAMSFTEILIFAIGLNVTAGLGAALFAFLDDRIGSRSTVIVGLIGLIVTGIAVLLIDDKVLFMVVALFLGLFVGPVQAASRTLAARISSPETIGQTYGLYAFTGKSVAFVGPFLYGLMTSVFATQRAGMSVIILFWLCGLGLLLLVREHADHQKTIA